MELLSDLLEKFASGIGPFILLLGLLIFVHELGHYLVAVWCGVRVETFSLGFGKKIFKYKRGHTTYCISIIPLGGYVKMFGDDPTQEMSAEEKKYSFLHKPVGQRIAIVLAGPLMNLFFAAFVFGAIHYLGEDVAGNKLGDVAPASAAYSAGFRSGDEILSIDGKPTAHWKELQQIIEDSAGRQLTFDVMREDGTSLQVSATPVLAQNEFIFTTQRQIGKIDGLRMESSAAMIGVPSADSAAANAGFKTFDVIEKINGKEVSYWRNINQMLVADRELAEWTFDVLNYPEKNQPLPASRQIVLANTFFTKDASTEILTEITDRLGIVRSDLFLLEVRTDAPAGKAGLLRGDQIIKVNQTPALTWSDVFDRIKNYTEDQKFVEFTVERSGEPITLQIVPEKTELHTSQGAIEDRFAIGIVPALMMAPNNPYLLQAQGLLDPLTYGIEKSWEWSKFIMISFVRLIQAEVSPRNVGGIITIGRAASQSYEAGTIVFLRLMAIISINLFILNLLPVPVLDGGHLVFFTIEAIKGSPLSLKKMELAQQFGLVLLLGLMVFALFNDIRNLFSPW